MVSWNSSTEHPWKKGRKKKENSYIQSLKKKKKILEHVSRA